MPSRWFAIFSIAYWTVLQTLPKLIELGHVCIARPPLYRVDAPHAQRKPAQKIYAPWMKANWKPIEDKLRKYGVRDGVGASLVSRPRRNNAEQLWEPPSTQTRDGCCRWRWVNSMQPPPTMRFNMLHGQRRSPGAPRLDEELA